LNLDEDQLIGSGILDSVFRPTRHVDRFTRAERMLDTVENHSSLTRGDKPVLGAILMELITKAFSRVNRDPLDLVTRFVIKHEVGTPGSFTSLSIRHAHIVA